MKKEIWKKINGFDGYEISSLGRVKSLSKTWVCGNRGSIRTKPETIMKLSICTNGYCQVDLSKGLARKKYFVHRLVALEFLKNRYNKPNINHKNSDRTDNRVENLEWCTQEENILHAYKKGRMYNTKGASHGMCKLTEEQVLEIRSLYGLYTQKELAIRFNIGRRTIGHIVNKKLWKHI